MYKEVIYLTTGDRMKFRRKELGLSAEKVAERLGVSPATIYRYEKGDIEKLPGDILPTLSEVLQTTPAYLMGWTEDETDPAVAPEGASPLSLSPSEIHIIQKFRALDSRGQSAVLNVLEHEYQAIAGDGPASSLPRNA